MGVRGLTSLLAKHAPRSLSYITANNLRNSVVAVDASCHLNKFVYAAEPYAHPHITGFYALARFCAQYNITPVFVFDGSTRIKQKYLEQQRRARVREKVRHSIEFERDRQQRLADWLKVIRSLTRDPSLPDVRRAVESLREQGVVMSEENADQLVMDIEDETEFDGGKELKMKLLQIAKDLRDARYQSEDSEKYTRTVRQLSGREESIMDALIQDKLKRIKSSLADLKAENHNQLVSLEKRSIAITHDMRKECMEFLSTLGYTCLICESHEAEAMCANLCLKKVTSATITEDMDALVFGDGPILRHFFARSRPILRVNPIIARRQLGLTKAAFVDLCILCGTDFSATIRGIGPVRALEYIRQYGSIEAMLPHLPAHYTPNENFYYHEARQVFNSLPDIPEINIKTPQQNIEAIADLLSRYEVDPNEIEERLQVMSLHHNQSNQAGWGADPFATTVE